MTAIAAAQSGGIWAPVTPIPSDAIEVLASPSGYTAIAPPDFHQPSPPTMPLQKLEGVFAGALAPTSAQFGIGLNRFPVIDSGVVGILDPGVVRIHDYSGGSASWRWSWAKIEATQGVYDWGTLDQVVDYFHSRGKQVVLTLWGTPTWASARPAEIGAYGAGWPGASAEPANLAHWDSWCSTIAARYVGRITHYEVWNEPQSTPFFSGTQTILSQLVRRAAVAVKAADPAALIVSPAVTGLNPGGPGLAYFLAMMQASDGAAGAMKDWVDVIGCHLYPSNLAGIKDVPYMLSGMRAHMVTLGVSAKPLWNTEFCVLSPDFNTLSEADRAEAIQALLTLSVAHNSGGADMTIWYNPDSTGAFAFVPADAAAFARHVSAMAGGITVVNKLADGRITAVIGGSQYTWLAA